MSVGRGQLLREGLLKNTPPTDGGEPTGRKKSDLEYEIIGFSPGSQCDRPPPLLQKTKGKRMANLPPRSTGLAVLPAKCPQNHIERMPPEILLKILSYLDALSLFSIGFVNKQFNEMANNNGMWHKIYSAEYGQSKMWRPKRKDELLDKLADLGVQEQTEGHWKKLYFRTMAGFNLTLWKQLRDNSPFTSPPMQTEQVLRHQLVTWEITVFDKLGFEGTFHQSRVYFSDLSVTVCWTSGRWPHLSHLATLQLDAVKREALRPPNIIKPGWRSLMAKFDLDTITINGHVIGRDQLVNLMLLSPGIIIGIWRGRWSIAFVMASFHNHRLLERSLLGTSICPYSPPEDKPYSDKTDPYFGLHGYTLRLILHDTVTQILDCHFPQLSCDISQIRGGFLQLNAISRENKRQHTPFSGRICLPWRCETLEGTVENCCIMNLTLLDEYQNTFWCVSTPVSMTLNCKGPFSLYQGQQFIIRYQDAEGKVRMDLVWLEEQRQYFLIHLVVSVSTTKVNKHFGKHYI
ncbi:hypothetical protein UPYG_G00280970 [Umbra pygmaea]|uniref:F-box domain-containing protein n=1 Tax=Umbra pygmaea TaxID=75934 RepID=A0ABD0WS08_UMBPY